MPNLKERLKEHAKKQSSKHMRIMRREIKKGVSFNQAHKTALKTGK